MLLCVILYMYTLHMDQSCHLYVPGGNKKLHFCNSVYVFFHEQIT